MTDADNVSSTKLWKRAYVRNPSATECHIRLSHPKSLTKCAYSTILADSVRASRSLKRASEIRPDKNHHSNIQQQFYMHGSHNETQSSLSCRTTCIGIYCQFSKWSLFKGMKKMSAIFPKKNENISNTQPPMQR